MNNRRKLLVALGTMTAATPVSEVFGAGTFLQSRTGARSRTMHNELMGTVSIKDFGAVGDGVANDTKAWVSFIAACVKDNKVGFINSGTFLIDPFTFGPQHTGLRLLGAVFNPQYPNPSGPGEFGLAASVIKLRSAQSRFLTFDGVYQTKFENFHMDGDGKADVVHYYPGVRNVTNLVFERCGIYGAKNATGKTIFMDGTNGGDQNYYNYCDFNGAPGHSTIVPLHHIHNTNSNAFRIYFDACHFSNAKTMFRYGAGSCSMSRCEVFGAVTCFYSIDNVTQDFSLVDIYTEQANTPFFVQNGNAGVYSNRLITLERLTLNHTGNVIYFNCQQPVRMLGCAVAGNINVTPMAKYGIQNIYVESLSFLATAGWSGTGFPSHVISINEMSSKNLIPTATSFGATAANRGVYRMTYSTSMTPDATVANQFEIIVTNGTAFTINNPTHPKNGGEMTITIYNGSGGTIGIITWDTDYVMSAWTNPAHTRSRSISFRYSTVTGSAKWIEVSRTPSDV